MHHCWAPRPSERSGRIKKAAGLFEAHAQGPPPLGMERSAGESAIGGGSLDDIDADEIDLD